MDDRPDQVGGWRLNWAFLACLLLIQPAAIASQDTVEDRAIRLLMEKHGVLETLRGYKASAVRWSRRSADTDKQRACLREPITIVDRQEYRWRLATDDVFYQQLVALVREDPNAGREWAEELVALEQSIADEVAAALDRDRRIACLKLKG